MSLTLSALRHLVEFGLTSEQILAVAEAQDEADAKTDTVAERKRAADRARMREKREVARQSRDMSSDNSDTVPFPLPLSPQTPLTPTPIPPDITTRARSIAVAKPNGFAKWWETYPNKVGKAAAEKAYAAACRKIGGPDPPRTLIDGLQRALASGVWDDGFIPHPTTWLNQGRWDDQPAPRNLPRKANDRPHHDKQGSDREESLRNHLSGAMAAVDRRIASMG